MALYTSDKELVQGLINSDNQAYKYLYDHYYAKLCRFALRFIEQKEDAEDIVQNIIFKIWDNKDSLKSVTNLSSYLYKSIQNTCLNHIKHEKIKQIHVAESLYILKELELSYSDVLVMNENEEKINHAIKNLPEQCQKVLVLSKIENLKNDEIATQLNMSKKSVEMNLYRALNKLRSILINPTMLILVLAKFFYRHM